MPKTKTPKTAARVYRAASYARLSVDDESYGHQRLGAQPARHNPRLRRRERRPEHRRRVLRRRLLGLHLREPPRMGQPARRRGDGKVDCIVVKD